jgi:hypothetical protein
MPGQEGPLSNTISAVRSSCREGLLRISNLLKNSESILDQSVSGIA